MSTKDVYREEKRVKKKKRWNLLRKQERQLSLQH